MKGANIVIGLSYTPDGDLAFDSGVALAQDLGASVVLVHALPRHFVPAGLSPDEAERLEEMELHSDVQEAVRLTTVYAAKARKEGVDAICVTAGGDPARAIIDAAKEHDAELIVVGTRRTRGITRALLGSFADRVVRLSDVPVLVVPAGKD